MLLASEAEDPQEARAFALPPPLASSALPFKESSEVPGVVIAPPPELPEKFGPEASSISKEGTGRSRRRLEILDAPHCGLKTRMDPRLKKEGSKCDHEVGTPASPSARSLQGASDRCSTASTRRHTSTLEESSTSQAQIYGARKEAAVCQKPPPPSSEETLMPDKKDILGAIEGTLQGIEDIAEMPYVDPREPLSQRALIDRGISLGMVVPTKPASHSPLKAIPTDHATVVSSSELDRNCFSTASLCHDMRCQCIKL
ncbi:uncharacterized protein LOC142589642 isoform X3 [Dermacentor variabilis]|uniref:uncharacterized protein LOC142589642 isoform X3 n=1 Tax=Dermacentor variabilis TaxID=34621 RepID=UPI003F5BBDED